MARDSGNRLNTANSIGLLVLLIPVVVWVLIPPFWLKVASFIVAECGFILFALKSDWTHSWSRIRQWFVGLLIAAVLAAAGIPQFYDQWKREHPKTTRGT